MLIYEQNSDILPLLRKSIEGLFNRMSLGFGVNDEEILLSIRRLGHMLYRTSVNDRSRDLQSDVSLKPYPYASKQQACHGVLVIV